MSLGGGRKVEEGGGLWGGRFGLAEVVEGVLLRAKVTRPPPSWLLGDVKGSVR